MRKLLPLLLSPLAWADGNLQVGLQQCAQLGDGAARLACYDALAAQPLPVPSVTSQAVQAAANPAPVAAIEPVANGVSLPASGAAASLPELGSQRAASAVPVITKTTSWAPLYCAPTSPPTSCRCGTRPRPMCGPIRQRRKR